MTSAALLVEQTDAMVQHRQNFDSLYQEIRDFIGNTHPAFTNPNETPGVNRRGQVWANSAERASETFAAGLHGLLTNPGTDWFGLRTQNFGVNEDYDAAVWLDSSRSRMLSVFNSPSSHFGTQLATIYRNIGDFGTAPMMMHGRGTLLPVFQERPLNEMYIAENEYGVVNRWHRKFALTANQAVSFFQGAPLSDKIKDAARLPAKALDKFDFIHCIYPRTERLQGLALATNMRWASDYVDAETKEFVARGGHHVAPIVTPRWRVSHGEIYGRSVGMKALADVRMQQEMMRLTVRAAGKRVDPPLQLAMDSNADPIRTAPSAITRISREFFLRGSGAVRPLSANESPEFGLEFVEYIARQIEINYFVHLLQISRDPRMTATQVLEITEETLRVLGPFLVRLQNELLGPVIRWLFNTMLRMGAFLPLPSVLRGQAIEIEYLSPAVQAQRLSEVRAIGQLQELTRPMVELDEAVADNLDNDAAYRWSADRLGVPRSVMRAPRQVAVRRQARQEAQQQQTAVEQAAALAPAAQSAAQAAASLAAANQNTPAQSAAA